MRAAGRGRLARTAQGGLPIVGLLSRLARTAQGGLPIVGLLSRLAAPGGGVGWDELAYPEFARALVDADASGEAGSSPSSSSARTSNSKAGAYADAVLKWQERHGKMNGQARYVNLYLWMAFSGGGGLVPARLVALSARRLAVTCVVFFFRFFLNVFGFFSVSLSLFCSLSQRWLVCPSLLPAPHSFSAPALSLFFAHEKKKTHPFFLLPLLHQKRSKQKILGKKKKKKKKKKNRQDIEIEVERFDQARAAALRDLRGFGPRPRASPADQVALAVDALARLSCGLPDGAPLEEEDARLLEAIVPPALAVARRYSSVAEGKTSPSSSSPSSSSSEKDEDPVELVRAAVASRADRAKAYE